MGTVPRTLGDLAGANLGIENLDIVLRGHPQGCGSGSQPAARASFTFCVTFLSLVTRVSLAGAVDGGGTEGAVIAYSTLIDPPYTLSVSAYACMCNVPAEYACPEASR